MKNRLCILVITIGSVNFAIADTCPDTINTSGGHYDLRGAINTYQRTLPSQMKSVIDEDCASYSNSDECEFHKQEAKEILAIAESCLGSPSKKISATSNENEGRRINNKTRTAYDHAKSDLDTDPWNNSARHDAPLVGCPYRYFTDLNLLHRPKVHICQNGATLQCGESKHKPKGKIKYEWQVVSDNACIKGANWVDARTIEQNSFNIRKANQK